jgi:hypothetical protein
MSNYSQNSGQEDIVYLDPSTSAIGAMPSQSPADPAGLASIMPSFFLFYSTPVPVSTKPRVPGLHPGAIWTGEDFDEPLPAEFWTGSE